MRSLPTLRKPKYLNRTLAGACCLFALQTTAHASSNKFYVNKHGNAVINITDTSGIKLSVTSGDNHGDVVYTLETSNGEITDTLSGVTGSLTILTSTGMDEIDLTSLEVKKSLNVFTRAGADSIEFSGLTIGKNLNIRTANGDDAIAGGFVDVGGSTNINTGRNADAVDIGSITTAGTLIVNSGPGNDLVDLEDMTTGGKTLVKTGNGADEVALTSIENTNQIRVSTGNGNDVVELAVLNFSAPSQFYLGAGDDTLELSESTFSSRPIFSGGKNNDTINTEDDNTFDEVTPKIVNFEETIDSSEPEEITYQLLDTGPGGGVVFEVNEDGTSGLEVFPLSVAAGAPTAYGCDGTNVDGVNDTPNGINDPQSGELKTAALVSANCGAQAAILASNFVSALDADDWFLPSAPELVSAMNQGILPVTSRAYWSSSEQTSGNAFLVFNTVNGPDVSSNSKSLMMGSGGNFLVVPVRSF